MDSADGKADNPGNGLGTNVLVESGASQWRLNADQTTRCRSSIAGLNVLESPVIFISMGELGAFLTVIHDYVLI